MEELKKGDLVIIPLRPEDGVMKIDKVHLSDNFTSLTTKHGSPRIRPREKLVKVTEEDDPELFI